MKAQTIALAALLSCCVAACGSDEVVGAKATATISLEFTPSTLELSETVDLSTQPDISAIADQIVCGALLPGSSTIELDGFSGGGDGESFELLGTLIDLSNSEELAYFSWTGTFSADAKAVTFASNAAGVESAALDRLKEILGQRSERRFTVKVELIAATVPASARFTVVQEYQVATENGTCP